RRNRPRVTARATFVGAGPGPGPTSGARGSTGRTIRSRRDPGGGRERGYSDGVDDRGRPTRRRWQDAAILLVVALEVVLTILLNSATFGAWRSALIAASGIALLWRHRQWPWLLPLLLTVNAAGWSLSILVIATYCY